MSDETKKAVKTAKAESPETKAKTAAKKAATKPAPKSATKAATKPATKTATKAAGKTTAKPATKSTAKSTGKTATTAKAPAKATAKTATKSSAKSKTTTITLDKSKAKAVAAKADAKADADAKAKTKPEVEVKVVKSRAKKSASDAKPKTDSPADTPPPDTKTDTPDATPPKDETQSEVAAMDSSPSDETGVNGTGEISGESPVYETQIDSLGRAYATGRRKEASARVWIKPGSGRVSVNGRDVKIYFARPVLRMLLGQPFAATGKTDAFDVTATVKGGGLSGQAGAVRHGISHALIRFDPELRPRLKAGGFLTRDSRAVERKKYGRRKARRSFQFSKR